MAVDKKETQHQFLALKVFKTINTQPSREAVPQDEAAWIENFMPIGDGFYPAVPQVGHSIATLTAALQFMRFANIGTVNYQICFNQAGGAQAVNLANSAVATIAPGGTFTDPSMDQWKSERIVIVDPVAGFSSWDGNLFYPAGGIATVTVVAGGTGYTAVPVVGFTGGGGTGATATASISGSSVATITLLGAGSGYSTAPSVTLTGGTAGTTATASAFIVPNGLEGSAVAVYGGRVWVAENRTLTYTAPNTWYDVNTANAAGSTTITEGFLRRAIQGLEALDNYLYVFGDSSIFIIGDLKVTGSITTFSLTNLSSTTGTTHPDTVQSLERAIIFANKQGVYAAYGASVNKISKALDGIFPDIDFNGEVSAGLTQIYNILCYVLAFTYTGMGGPRSLQAVYFDGKWFLTSQGTSVDFVSGSQIDGDLGIWCSSGTELRRMYQDTTSTIATTLQSALMPLGSPIFDKQMIRVGLEYTAPEQTSITLSVDTENATDSQQFNANSTLIWYNNSGQQITWVNNGNNEITWLASGFLAPSRYSGLVGKYIGFTVTSNSPQVVLNGILSEFEQRASWGP